MYCSSSSSYVGYHNELDYKGCILDVDVGKTVQHCNVGMRVVVQHGELEVDSGLPGECVVGR